MIKTQEVEQEVQYDPACAWCLQEQGTLDSEEQQSKSHGICTFHADLEVAKFGFSKVKPFVERFRR
jgi:hypothetical protein